MNYKQFVVNEDGIGKRIDVYLTGQIADLTRSQLQRLFEEKQVFINGRLVKANYKLKAEDIITCKFSEPETISVLPENIPLQIVYEDDDLIVVNKPRGMLVYPASGKYSGTLVNALLFHCHELSKAKNSLRPGIVHRIDKDTTGLLVAAKKDDVHDDLVRQFKECLVRKEYLALVHGMIAEPGGVIDAPIGRDIKNRQRMAVVMKNSKQAVTKYQVIERLPDYTLLRCQLETGRTHQIRVHLAYLQYPVAGDPKYITSELQREKGRRLGLMGQALHAFTLSFIHPRNQERLVFKVAPPQDFLEALRILGSAWASEQFIMDKI